MAITYKSQGSGVATETSGAALSPLCPATVDAGDILIAHVFWEGTATAPSTPGTWTLLSGPHVIETTIARHWVFGKIADGTEDGAAVAFGAPAVTTQRAARIYSFAGRTGGTITELVNGFAPTSHATDPQMPTVTTTLNGSLAVALIAQNDNNTMASPTGETGGDWVEAVAEFTANLTPGLSLGIVRAVPTGDPGTITGGSDNTTNDPVGVVGFQIKPSSPVEVSPGVGQVLVTGNAPTFQASTHLSVEPGVGQVIVTGIAPTVQATNHLNIEIGLGEIVANGFAPTFQTEISVNPGTGEVVAEGFAPTVQITDHKSIETGLGEIIVTGYEATFQNTNHVQVSPGLGELIVEGFAPTFQTTTTVEPQTGNVTVTGYAPDVTVTDHQNILVGTGQVIVTGFSPDMGGGINVETGSGDLIITGFEPTFETSDNISIVTATGELIITGFEPTVEISSIVAVEPGTGVVVVTGFAPTMGITRRVFILRRSKIRNDDSKISRIKNELKKSKIESADLKSVIKNDI